jgi:hypothetical protein
MNAKALIEAMASKGYWTSPGGATPHATLYAAITREITTKGNDARFTKASKGHFTATKNATPSAPRPGAQPTTATRTKGKKKPAAGTTTIPDGTPGPESMQELFRLG